MSICTLSIAALVGGVATFMFVRREAAAPFARYGQGTAASVLAQPTTHANGPRPGEARPFAELPDAFREGSGPRQARRQAALTEAWRNNPPIVGPPLLRITASSASAAYRIFLLPTLRDLTKSCVDLGTTADLRAALLPAIGDRKDSPRCAPVATSDFS